MPDDSSLTFVTRLWFAWLCFFRILFDGPFATRAWALHRAGALPHGALPGAVAPELRLAPGASQAPAASLAGAAPAAAPGTTSALQLLSLLQREGRLVDFLQQDIGAFADADVGVAARVVHEGCRRALGAHADIEPVLAESEGAHVKLEAGFDADEVKLVGDVRGQPPYTGVLRHRGWRAKRMELPTIVGVHDARVLAPAEVELR